MQATSVEEHIGSRHTDTEFSELSEGAIQQLRLGRRLDKQRLEAKLPAKSLGPELVGVSTAAFAFGLTFIDKRIGRGSGFESRRETRKS